jgi:rsbT antagonist protein RsbS
MVRLREDLVEAIGHQRTRGVIIDVAALEVLDSFGLAPSVTSPK